MAKTNSPVDRFTQKAVMETTISMGAGATTTTLKKLETGLTNLQKVAWDVRRISYDFPVDAFSFLGGGLEYLEAAVTASSSSSQNSNFTNASLYDIKKFAVAVTAAAATPVESLLKFPIYTDFPTGMLMLPQNLYSMTRGWDSAAAHGPYPLYIQIDYFEVELGPEDWYDLLQLRMPLGAT